MKLNEIMTPIESGFLTDYEEIKNVLHHLDLDPDMFTVHDDNSVSVEASLQISKANRHYIIENGKLKIKFRDVKGDFDVFDTELTTLEGFPTSIGRHCDIHGNKLTSLDFISPYIAADLWIEKNNITSLEGIGDKIKQLRSITLDANTITSGGIGLLTISGLENIFFASASFGYPSREPFQIIQKYNGRPEDIFECQAELIEAGYAEYAKL